MRVPGEKGWPEDMIRKPGRHQNIPWGLVGQQERRDRLEQRAIRRDKEYREGARSSEQMMPAGNAR